MREGFCFRVVCGCFITWWFLGFVAWWCLLAGLLLGCVVWCCLGCFGFGRFPGCFGFGWGWYNTRFGWVAGWAGVVGCWEVGLVLWVCIYYWFRLGVFLLCGLGDVDFLCRWWWFWVLGLWVAGFCGFAPGVVGLMW